MFSRIVNYFSAFLSIVSIYEYLSPIISLFISAIRMRFALLFRNKKSLSCERKVKLGIWCCSSIGADTLLFIGKMAKEEMLLKKAALFVSKLSNFFVHSLVGEAGSRIILSIPLCHILSSCDDVMVNVSPFRNFFSV